MGKKVYLKGKAHYIRPYHLDLGENLEEGSDIRNKIEKTGGIYSTLVKLNFDNRDDAEEYIVGLGIPTGGLLGNLLKRVKNEDGTVDIFYKVHRPHLEPNFDEPVLGPPDVVDEYGAEWNPETLIGNGSDVTVKLDVWIGNKATKIRWDGVRVDNLVPYESSENQENF